MRLIALAPVAAVCALLFTAATPSPAVAGFYQDNGNYIGTPSNAVTDVFVQFPGGGSGLADAVAQLLVSNPSLAADVAFIAANGNHAQQLAAGAGMGQAQAALAAAGNSSAAAQIAQAAQASGNSTVIAAASLATGETGSNTLTQNTQICTTTIISPNRPVTICQ